MSVPRIPPPVSRALSCAALSLLGGAVYLHSLHNPFVYDDFRTVVDNGSIASIRDLAAIVAHEATRPLTNLSFAVDRRIWGNGPFGFHLTNVLLHMLNVTLVFSFASRVWSDMEPVELRSRRRPRGETVAAIAAGLFAVHPVMSEAVGYISSRSDLLCASLVLSAFLAARTWMLNGPRRWCIAAWGLWVAALLAKETAAVLPLLVLVYALSPAVDSVRRKQAIASLAVPMVLVMAVAAAFRLLVLVLVEQARVTSSQMEIATLAIAFWDYVRLLCVPAGQSIFHAIRPSSGAADVRAWLAFVALVAAAAVGWRFRRRAPAAVFGGCWFALLILPAVLLGVTDPGSAVAEHRAYLPAAGFFLFAGALAGEASPLLNRFTSTRLLAPLAFASVVLMLGGRTYVRTLVWADPATLWREATGSAPTHWLPFAALGDSLHSDGRHDEAVIAYQRSMTLRPDNETVALNLVVCLSELSREREAYTVVADLERMHPASPYVSIGRGAIAMMAERKEEAKQQFLEALVRDPENVMARQWLAVLAEESNDRAEALHRCYELQRLIPGRLSVDSCIERSRRRP